MGKTDKTNKAALQQERGKQQRKIRLVDIAERAGVSISSVSRMVRGVSNIDQDICRKIEAAMAELNIDRSYFSKKVSEPEEYKFVVLCIHDILEPFYPLLIRGIEEVANTHQYGIILFNMTGNSQEQCRKLKILIQTHNVKGVVYVPMESSLGFIDDLIRDRIPIVLIENIPPGLKACCVASDNRGAARSAIKYLISLGHHRIVYLAGNEQFTAEKEKYAGYCDALKDAGIPIDLSLRADGLNDFQRAYDSITAKINQGIEFTAVFCASDLMAFAAKQALEKHGFAVPGDISLMGFDDVPFSSAISLTTFSKPAYDMGRNAMMMLLDLINNRITPPKHVILQPTIKIRNSCRRHQKNFEDSARSIAEGRTIKIGYTPPADSEFYDIIKHGAYTMMRELSDRFGVKFEFEMVAPREHKAVQDQIAAIENWVSQRFDAVLVCSSGDYDTMNPVYKRAMDNGTAIYMFNMPAEMWDQYNFNAISVIGYDNYYQAGYLVGQYAAEKLRGSGDILLIWGIPGHWATSRKNGFLEAIRPYPGLRIVGQRQGDYLWEKGMEATREFLMSHPNVNLIYGENEEMAQGAAEAVEACGLKLWDGKDGIIVIGADGLRSGYESIREGKLTATVNVSPVDQGREFIMAVFMHEALGYNVDRIINVSTMVVDKSNVDTAAAYTDWALGTEYP